MHRHWQNGNRYGRHFLRMESFMHVLITGRRRRVCIWMFTALAALAGCGGKGEEDFLPSPKLSAGETVREGGIVIEFVSDAKEKQEMESAAGMSEEAKAETHWTQEEEEEGTIENKASETLSPNQVYPGEILNKEDVETAGEDGFFTCFAISDAVFERMEGNSYKEGCPVSREDLRYLRILHYDFSGNIRVGELVCHQSVSEDMVRIFRELYKAGYPIEKVALIDDYGGDDDLSSRDNNTSCFNYRTVAGSDKLSLHGLGVAIDVNPLYNPYITWNAQGELSCAPSNGAAYADRSGNFPYKIDEDDLCCRLFTQAGFTWGGNWTGRQDYMHFSRRLEPET